MKKIRLAIVGATGLVGRTVLKVLEEKELPIDEYVLFASKNSAGNKLRFMDRDYIVQELNDLSFDSGFDYAIFSAGGTTAKIRRSSAIGAGRRRIPLWNFATKRESARTGIRSCGRVSFRGGYTSKKSRRKSSNSTAK